MSPSASPFDVTPVLLLALAVAPGGEAPDTIPEMTSSSGAIVRTVVVPGMEQRRLGQRRWLLYAGAELVGWGGWVAERRSEGRLRGAYRDLAWDVARSPLWDGERRDGSWDYYETLARFESSGRFDLDPGLPRIVPESDPGTYNGRIWLLAREIHFPGGPDTEVDPESDAYARALTYYVERAISPPFAWDWEGDTSARHRYAELIRRSDDAARSATAFLGLLLVNRFISAADAHLAHRSSSDRRARLDSSLARRASPGGGGWELTLHIYPPRPVYHP